jgi:hypothetical protein
MVRRTQRRTHTRRRSWRHVTAALKPTRKLTWVIDMDVAPVMALNPRLDTCVLRARDSLTVFNPMITRDVLYVTTRECLYVARVEVRRYKV